MLRSVELSDVRDKGKFVAVDNKNTYRGEGLIIDLLIHNLWMEMSDQIYAPATLSQWG